MVTESFGNFMNEPTLSIFCTAIAAWPTISVADALALPGPLVAFAVFGTDVPEAIAEVMLINSHTVPIFV